MKSFNMLVVAWFMLLPNFSALAADKPQVLLIMSSHASKPKGELLLSLAKNKKFELVNYATKGKTDEQVDKRWQTADLILLDGINPALSKFMFGKYAKQVEMFADVPVVSLGDLSNKSMNQGLTEAKRTTIADYYNNAGRENYANLMAYLEANIFQLSDQQVPAPSKTPNVGLYHYNYQNPLTDDESGFFNWLAPKENQPVIAIAMHRSAVDYEQQQVIDAMIKGLEQKGAKAFGFYFEGNDEPLEYTDFLTDEKGKTRVNLMINYRSLHYVEKRRAEFEKLGVPIIHVLNYTEGSEAEFEQDNAGISPSLTPFFPVMP